MSLIKNHILKAIICIFLIITIALLVAIDDNVKNNIKSICYHDDCKECMLSTCKICYRLIPFVEVVLTFCFLSSISWAIIMYNNSRGIGRASLHDIANRHNVFLQIWFNISISIFLGGVIYATFHLSAVECHYFGYSEEDWKFEIFKALPNMFVYSLFFVAWYWATKNYTIHWHHFVTNEYRECALHEFDRMLKDKEAISKTAIDKIYVLKAFWLTMPGSSAYAAESKEGGTAIERLLRLEELIREQVTAPQKDQH